MSRRPGIGRGWIEKYISDVYPGDKVVVRQGVIGRPPKYYDKIYDCVDPEKFAIIKSRRLIAAKDSPDNSSDRLFVRERLQMRKLEELVRTIE